MKKIPKKVLEIQTWQKEPDKGAKSISFSQLSMFANCPRCWYRTYIKKEAPYVPSIHAIFGTAFHETLQTWLNVLYNKTVKEADALNVNEMLLEKFRILYAANVKAAGGNHFSTPKELEEFYNDGVAILDYIRKHRKAYFAPKGVHLVGCEIPIWVKLQEKFYFKGFIDILTYDEKQDRWKIWDVKTSTRGWGATEKGDSIKTSQVILYREFLSRQFNIPADKIDIEYFIVKRKIMEDAEFASMKKRVQEFVPTSGPRKTKQTLQMVTNFLTESVVPETGAYREREYSPNPSDKNCKWCLFKGTCEGVAAL